jgi:hypothetical protein
MVLADWDLNREFQMLLASFESTLPLRKPSCLAEKRLAVKLLSMSEGTIGELSRILVAAATHAIESGEERILYQLVAAGLSGAFPSAELICCLLRELHAAGLSTVETGGAGIPAANRFTTTLGDSFLAFIEAPPSGVKA